MIICKFYGIGVARRASLYLSIVINCGDEATKMGEGDFREFARRSRWRGEATRRDAIVGVDL